MKIFGIGMRNIKTGLSVFITIIICGIFTQISGVESTGFYGAITAVICMQNFGTLTTKMGVERVAGSFIGAVVSLAIYMVIGLPSGTLSIALLVLIGTIISIHITNILEIPLGSTVAAIMVLAAFTVVPENAVVITTIVRLFETIIGVIIASLINNYVYPYKPEESI